jgi:hypothetical protein
VLYFYTSTEYDPGGSSSGATAGGDARLEGSEPRAFTASETSLALLWSLRAFWRAFAFA